MADRSNLPAPYESPWRQLGRALQAVAASLRLDLRCVWRQNRSGDLPTPPWWPRAIASLFWPLALVVPIALLGALVSVIPGPAAAPPAAMDTRTPMAEPVPPKAEPAPAEPIPINVPAPPMREPVIAPAAAPDGPSPAQGALADPLLAAITQGDQPSWVVAAQGQPARSLLVLTLEPGFARLPLAQRQRLGSIWLERSQNAGFDHLELRSSRGERLGYQARIGSGMILLTSEPTP